MKLKNVEKVEEWIEITSNLRIKKVERFVNRFKKRYTSGLKCYYI